MVVVPVVVVVMMVNKGGDKKWVVHMRVLMFT